MNYQFNDAGRSLSKRPKQSNDCVIRAISLLSKLDYDDVYGYFQSLGRKCSRGTNKKDWQTLLNKQKDLKKISFPAQKGKPRMNLRQFCSFTEFNNGRYLVQMAKHVVYVCDGVVYDTFEPDGEKCVYAVWKALDL